MRLTLPVAACAALALAVSSAAISGAAALAPGEDALVVRQSTERILDTGSACVRAGEPRTVSVTDGGSGPTDVSAVLISVSVVDADSSGFLRVSTYGEPVPAAISLAFQARTTSSAQVLVVPGPRGRVIVSTSDGCVRVQIDKLGQVVDGARVLTLARDVVATDVALMPGTTPPTVVATIPGEHTVKVVGDGSGTGFGGEPVLSTFGHLGSGLPGSSANSLREPAGVVIGMCPDGIDCTREHGAAHGGFSAVADFAPIMWVVDSGNHDVRTQTSSSFITTGSIGLPQSLTTSNVGPSRAGRSGGVPLEPGTSDRRSQFNSPRGVDLDAHGVVYVADTGNHTVRKLVPVTLQAVAGTSSAGPVTVGVSTSTLAGLGGVAGYRDAKGLAARFRSPKAVAVDASGIVYVADTGNHVIRRIARDGRVTTLAGVPGDAGFSDGDPQEARFRSPAGIDVAPDGSIYVADTGNHVIRRISETGTVTTIAGTPGSAGFADGTGSASRFSSPQGLEVDVTGDVYVADTGNARVRIIHPEHQPGVVVPVPPRRLLDTAQQGVGCLSGTATRTLPIPAAAGLPADASAAIVSLTTLPSLRDGALTMRGAGDAQAATAQVPYLAADRSTTLLTVPVGDDLAIGITNNQGCAEAKVDLLGYVTAPGVSGSAVRPVSPARAFTTRGADSRCIASDAPRRFQVRGVGGVPASASAALLQIRVHDSTAATNVRLRSAGVTADPIPAVRAIPARPRTVQAWVALESGDAQISVGAGCVDVTVDVVGYQGPRA